MSDFKLEPRYVVLKIADVLRLRRQNVISADELSALHSIEVKTHADRLQHNRGGLDCLVVEKDWPEYQTTLDAIEKRVVGKPDLEYWYLVSWNSANGKDGCTEVPLSQPWSAGDLTLVIEHLRERNPSALSLCVVSVIPIAPPQAKEVMDA